MKFLIVKKPIRIESRINREGKLVQNEVSERDLTFIDNVPVYKQLDENDKVIQHEVKKYFPNENHPDGGEWKRVKEDLIYSKSQVAQLQSSGVFVKIVSEESLKEEAAKMQALIDEAYQRGVDSVKMSK